MGSQLPVARWKVQLAVYFSYLLSMFSTTIFLFYSAATLFLDSITFLKAKEISLYIHCRKCHPIFSHSLPFFSLQILHYWPCKFVLMGPRGWDIFLDLLESTYYTQIVVTMTSVFLLYVILRKLPRKRLAYLFLVYAISCIVLFVGLAIHLIFSTATGRRNAVIIESANTLFAICELCVFLIFFFQVIDSKISKRFLLIFSAAFIRPGRSIFFYFHF